MFDGSSGEGLFVSCLTQRCRSSDLLTSPLTELKDDSHVIPRSSSVVVKRVPPARPGKGKASMYISNPGTSATPEAKPSTQAGSSSWATKGSMSRRFDKEAALRPATVRIVELFFLFYRSIFSSSLMLPYRIPPGSSRKSDGQGRRGGRDGSNVPGSVRELGGDSGKNVTVGVASWRSSPVM
jgi:hypothetical protein